MKSGNKRVPPGKIRDCMRKTARRIWCSGCGNGICMGALIRAIIRLQIPRDEVAIVSGIGCGGRGSAYVDFDSIQTPHGRAIPCATGIKLIRPNMHVIVFSGDGDITGIGGNHLIHAARRNIGITVIVVNNRIYGMTGGQVAPTTHYGDFASTAPYGHIESPFDICVLAIGAGATYVARSTTYHVNRLDSLIEKGLMNKGFSVIEVISQCPTYYGKLNRIGGPAEMLLWLKEKSVSIKNAEMKSPEDIEGKIIIGEFVSKERPELSEEYHRLNEMVQRKED
ncbi:thiamine pyrophosphate-dependent enzyme [Thermodesulfobacteriota bacterium]